MDILDLILVRFIEFMVCNIHMIHTHTHTCDKSRVSNVCHDEHLHTLDSTHLGVLCALHTLNSTHLGVESALRTLEELL